MSRPVRPPSTRAFIVVPIAVAAGLGMLVGVGVFTFGYAQGFSYFMADPRACANCHVMQDYFDTWQKGSHHHAAVCVDCHLPHTPVRKYMAKADNGFFHSLAFTLDNFHEPIQIKARNRKITRQNCMVCHADIVHQMRPEAGADGIPACTHCHGAVGHGP
jgi:cytochrome c nitrite reductase small subunit